MGRSFEEHLNVNAIVAGSAWNNFIADYEVGADLFVLAIKACIKTVAN